MHSPKLLILDEPFIGLDPEGQKIVKSLIKELVEDGGGALISTHMLDMVEKICHKATILHLGRCIAQGNVLEIKRRAGLSREQSLEEAFLRIIHGGRRGA